MVSAPFSCAGDPNSCPRNGATISEAVKRPPIDLGQAELVPLHALDSHEAQAGSEGHQHGGPGQVHVAAAHCAGDSLRGPELRSGSTDWTSQSGKGPGRDQTAA